MGLGSFLQSGLSGFAPGLSGGGSIGDFLRNPAGNSDFIRDEILGGKEANEAARARVQGARDAANLFRDFSSQLREQAAPLRTFRNENLTSLLDLIRGGSDFTNSAEYRNVLNAASGVGAGTPFERALSDRARGLASTQFSPFSDRIATQAGVSSAGLNSTNAQLQENANRQAALLSQAGREAGEGILSQNRAATQTATGAAALLASLFCDERLKKNIKKLGHLDNGVEIFEWEWKDDRDAPTIGPIAQKVQKTHPESVFEDEDGYLRVNLLKLTGISKNELARSFDG